MTELPSPLAGRLSANILDSDCLWSFFFLPTPVPAVNPVPMGFVYTPSGIETFDWDDSPAAASHTEIYLNLFVLVGDLVQGVS